MKTKDPLPPFKIVLKLSLEKGSNMILDQSKNIKEQKDLRLSVNLTRVFVLFCTKQIPLQNLLDNTSKWLEHDSSLKQKQETTRFAISTKFDQGHCFVHTCNPTKSAKRSKTP